MQSHENPHKKANTNNHHYVKCPNNLPQKEFELLYRQRDNLPSQEAYESVIFMKSKKCPNSISRANSKKSLRKPSSGKLRSMIRNLEKEIRIQEHKSKSNNKSRRTPQFNRNNVSRTKTTSPTCNRRKSPNHFNETTSTLKNQISETSPKYSIQLPKKTKAHLGISNAKSRR